MNIGQREGRLLLVLFSMLPLVIFSDEVLYRLNGSAMLRSEILITLGLHTVNLQTVVAAGFFFSALFWLAYRVFGGNGSVGLANLYLRCFPTRESRAVLAILIVCVAVLSVALCSIAYATPQPTITPLPPPK